MRPGGPTGLTTSGITQTAITLNWTKPAGSTGFQVNGGALTGLDGSWRCGDLPVHRTDSQHGLHVASAGAELGRGHQRRHQLQPRPCPTRQPARRPPRSPSTASSSVGRPALAAPTGYEVSSDGTTWVDSGSDTEHVFTGLTPSTAYTLQVRAKNVSGRFGGGQRGQRDDTDAFRQRPRRPTPRRIRRPIRPRPRRPTPRRIRRPTPPTPTPTNTPTPTPTNTPTNTPIPPPGAPTGS